MSLLTLNERSAPTTPSTDKGSHYNASGGTPRFVNDQGVDAILIDTLKYNYVRNGGMWFAQRQAPATPTTYSATAGRAISADGWGITNENASASYQRVDTIGSPETGLVAQFYGQFLKTTSNGKLVISQVIESKDVAAMRGQTVRLQCVAKAVGASITWRLALVQLTSAGSADTIPATFISAFGGASTDPTLGTNLSFIAPKSGVTPDGSTVDGNAVEALVGGSVWQQIGAVFDVPSTAKNLVLVLFSDVQVTAGAGINLSQCSLTIGQDVQMWSPLSYEQELRRVLRYYQKTFALDTAPAQAAGVTTGCLRCILGKAGATALAAQFQWRYQVALRIAAVTATTYSPASANATVRQISGTAADLTATTTANSTDESIDITATGAAGGAVGDQCGVHVSVDSEM